MDEQSTARLKEILRLLPSELTPEQIAFLKARIAYVGKNSRAKFAEVLTNPTPEAPKPQETALPLEGTSIHPADVPQEESKTLEDPGTPEEKLEEPQKATKGKKNKTVTKQVETPINKDAVDIENDDDGDTEAIESIDEDDDEVVE